jgi:hypothetical protein
MITTGLYRPSPLPISPSTRDLIRDYISRHPESPWRNTSLAGTGYEIDWRTWGWVGAGALVGALVGYDQKDSATWAVLGAGIGGGVAFAGVAAYDYWL